MPILHVTHNYPIKIRSASQVVQDNAKYTRCKHAKLYFYVFYIVMAKVTYSGDDASLCSKLRTTSRFAAIFKSSIPLLSENVSLHFRITFSYLLTKNYRYSIKKWKFSGNVALPVRIAGVRRLYDGA